MDVCASAARAARVAAITVTSSFNASPSHHEHASFVALWNSPCAHSCATVPGIDRLVRAPERLRHVGSRDAELEPGRHERVLAEQPG